MTLEFRRSIMLYVDRDNLEPADIERLAADYGYIVANPRKNGDSVTLLNKDGSRLTPPYGMTVWITDLVASEHDEESA